MSQVADHRCFNHAARQAAARCPQCTRFFCRECTTEHRGRIICANCLGTHKDRRARRRALGAAVGRVLLLAAALCIVWSAFALGGRLLLLLPSEFHEGVLWQDAQGDGS